MLDALTQQPGILALVISAGDDFPVALNFSGLDLDSFTYAVILTDSQGADLGTIPVTHPSINVLAFTIPRSITATLKTGAKWRLFLTNTTTGLKRAYVAGQITVTPK